MKKVTIFIQIAAALGKNCKESILHILHRFVVISRQCYQTFRDIVNKIAKLSHKPPVFGDI